MKLDTMIEKLVALRDELRRETTVLITLDGFKGQETTVLITLDGFKGHFYNGDFDITKFIDDDGRVVVDIGGTDEQDPAQ